MKCPECQLELDSNGLIAWCENGHAYKLESTEYPCFVADGTYCSVHTPAETTPDAECKPGLIGRQVYDRHFQRWRTVVEQKPSGAIKVKDGNEDGEWLDTDEYEVTREAEPTPVLPTPVILDAKKFVDEYKGEK